MWKWCIVILAIAGAVAGVRMSTQSVKPLPVPPPIHEPVRKPYPQAIAGAGLVEAASENVSIGVSEPGLVLKVCVKEGDVVKKGDCLFEVDARALKSQLLTAKAAVLSAEAELARVQAYRRKEDEGPLRAKLAQANASVADSQCSIAQSDASVVEQEWVQKDNEAKVKRLQITVKGGATPEEELERAEYAVKLAVARVATAREAVKVAQAKLEVAKTGVEQAQADLNTFLAGAWPPDVRKAQAAVAEAQAKVEQLNMDIERHTVRAPLDATVLRVNLREGEYVVASTVQPEGAVMVLGDLSAKHVRTDIDEFDAKRFKPGAPATAFLKGITDKPIPLQFVRVEPFVIPKRALTNTQRELVDTRVLQVIYKVVDPQANIYVGQQLDVYVEAK
ncbi:MAG TPA: biotin/lipoyl-binding protein [Planctomycetota bacterium]|jgi:multidrug efflux pump subunit AcrA (membrane-fusion protein)